LLGGGSLTFTINGDVPYNANATQITTTVVATMNPNTLDLFNRPTISAVLVQPRTQVVNLRITGTSSPPSVIVLGDVVMFTIAIYNDGPSEAFYWDGQSDAVKVCERGTNSST